MKNINEVEKRLLTMIKSMVKIRDSMTADEDKELYENINLIISTTRKFLSDVIRTNKV